MRAPGVVAAWAAGIALLIGLAAAFFYSPPFQHWLLTQIIDPGPDDQLTVDRARIGFARTAIQGFELQTPRLHYRAGDIQADLSLWDILFRDHVEIKDLRIAGLIIDLTGTAAPRDREPFEGVLRALDLPAGLTLREGRIEGRLVFPGDGSPPADLTFLVTGEGIAPGSEGRFRLAADFRAPSRLASLDRLEVEGGGGVRQDKQGRFDRLLVEASAASRGADGRELPDLVAEAILQRSATAETYEIHLALTGDDRAPDTRIYGDAVFSHENRSFDDCALRLIVDDRLAAVAHGEVSLPEQAVRLSLTAQLPALLNQPFIADRHRLMEGEMLVELEASLEEPGSVDASLVLYDVAIETGEGREALFPASLRLGATQTESDSWMVEMPLRIQRPDLPSEIVLEGEVAIDGSPERFDLQLAGERFILPDLLNMIDAIEFPEREEDEERHDSSFWRGRSGTLAIDLDALHFGDGLSAGHLRGEVTAAENGIGGTLHGTFLGGPGKLDAWLEFDEENKYPYELTGYISASALDFAALFSNWIADRPPLVDGLLDARGEFSGEGANPADLIAGLRGHLDLRGEDGRFHLFYTDGLRARIGLAIGGALGILGLEPGTINEIADRLAAIEYDEITARFERRERFDLKLSDFRLLAPEFHLSGAGAIKDDEDVDFIDQSLALELELAVRGEMEDLLDRAAVLSDHRDELDYRKMYAGFPIHGSLADLDLSAFFHVLTDAALGLVLPFAGRIDRDDDEEKETDLSGDDDRRGEEVPDRNEQARRDPREP